MTATDTANGSWFYSIDGGTNWVAVGAVTDAINQSGLQTDLQYLGGGSGRGEAGLVDGTQGSQDQTRAHVLLAR